MRKQTLAVKVVQFIWNRIRQTDRVLILRYLLSRARILGRTIRFGQLKSGTFTPLVRDGYVLIYYYRLMISRRYCKDRWIWTHEYIQKDNANKEEGCQWLARSPMTKGYDLTESAGLKWEIWTGAIVEAEVEIAGNGCADPDDCNLNGECIDGGCVCSTDNDGVNYYGEKCEIKLKDKCRTIVNEVDNATWSVSSMGSNGLFEHYSRPVYTYVQGTSRSGRLDKELGENDIYVMNYSGLRWYAGAWKLR